MKLLIDISEEAYKMVQDNWLAVQAEGTIFENAVLNGKVVDGEVVRCESCKHWNSRMKGCVQSVGERNYDDFCSRGVKNELKAS